MSKCPGSMVLGKPERHGNVGTPHIAATIGGKLPTLIMWGLGASGLVATVLVITLLASRFRKRRAGGLSKGDLTERARAVLAYDQVEEQRLASDQAYRTTKISEFAEIIEVAKAACQSAGRRANADELDYIMTRGTVLFAGWGEIRPRLEATPAALFACSAMIVFCWSTPQSAIKQFALHEAKPGDTPETTSQLISTTATSLEKIMSQMGLG